jgi:hypothetical protein
VAQAFTGGLRETTVARQDYLCPAVARSTRTPESAAAATATFLRRQWLPVVCLRLAIGVSVLRLVLGKQNSFRVFRFSFPSRSPGSRCR